ncbi:hypothetical protein D3C85_1420350 [compost metagenome]
MFQVAERQALRRTGECDARFQLLSVLRAHLQTGADVQGFDGGFNRLGSQGLGLLHAFQASDMLVDSADFSFQSIESFRLLGVQGGAVFRSLVHDGGHFGGFGYAGCFELRDLFRNGFHV